MKSFLAPEWDIYSAIPATGPEEEISVGWSRGRGWLGGWLVGWLVWLVGWLVGWVGLGWVGWLVELGLDLVFEMICFETDGIFEIG